MSGAVSLECRKGHERKDRGDRDNKNDNDPGDAEYFFESAFGHILFSCIVKL